MREVEKEISKLKNEEYKRISTPVCCFITFEDEDGVNRALDYQPTKSWLGEDVFHGDLILGVDKLAFVESSEPTNIIWENRRIEGFERWKRFFISSLIIVILVSLSFTVILLCKQYSIKVQQKYPDISCNTIEETYKNNNYEFWAGKEWDAYYHPEEDAERREFTGVLPCYCYAKT